MMTQKLDYSAAILPFVLRRSAALAAQRRVWLLPALCWVTLGVLYISLAWTLNNYHSIWSPDVGARFGMVHNWLAHGRLFYLEYANAAVDPAGRIFPLAGYSVHLPGGVCIVYPPLFPFLSALEYRLFGFGGLTLLPLLGGFGTLIVASATAKRLALGGRPLLPLVPLTLILGLATPVLIYSVVFWDHSLEMFLTALAGYGMLRSLEEAHTGDGAPAGEEGRAGAPRARAGFALAAGAALGVGVWFHEAFLALFLAAALAGLSLLRLGPVRRAAGLLALGFVPPVLAWAAFNGAVYGAPTGPHLMGPNNLLNPYHVHTALDPAALSRRVVSQLLGAEGATGGVAVLGACLIAYPLCARLKFLARLRPQGLALLHLAAAGAALVAILGASWVHGLFTATPLLVPALAAPFRPRPDPGGRAGLAPGGPFYAWVGRTCVVFILGVLLSGNDPGLEWGSRYLLTALPLLVLLAAKAAEGQWRAAARGWKPVVLAGFLALVGVSACSEARAWQAVRGDLVYSRALIRAARAAPSSVLVTDRWWLPPELTAGDLPQTQFLADTPEGRSLFVATLAACRAPEFTYMGSPAGLMLFTQAVSHGNTPYALKSAWDGGGLRLARFVLQAPTAASASAPVSHRVLALYYPWYGTPQVSGQWMHQEGVDTARKVIADHTHYAVGGPYDSADPAVIDRHLQQAHDAGIDTLVCSWWGPKDATDKAIRLLLRRAGAHSMKVCVLWEHLSPPGGADGATADLSYLLGSITQHPSYLREGGKPVVFVYAGTSQGLSADQWSGLLNRSGAGGVRLIGVAQSAGDALLWDGFYDLNTTRPLAGLSLAECARVQSESFQTPLGLARRFGGIAVETVKPGVDDRRASPPGVPQAGTFVDRRGGQLYAALWEQALRDGPDWVLIDSFNQWHTGTEIEPSVELGDQYLTLTRQFSDRFRQGTARPPKAPAGPAIKRSHAAKAKVSGREPCHVTRCHKSGCSPGGSGGHNSNRGVLPERSRSFTEAEEGPPLGSRKGLRWLQAGAA